MTYSLVGSHSYFIGKYLSAPVLTSANRTISCAGIEKSVTLIFKLPSGCNHFCLFTGIKILVFDLKKATSNLSSSRNPSGRIIQSESVYLVY